MRKRDRVSVEDPGKYTRDVAEAGRLASITGRRGQFRVHALETNTATGATWYVMWGPVGDPGGNSQWTHARPADVAVESTRKYNARRKRESLAAQR